MPAPNRPMHDTFNQELLSEKTWLGLKVCRAYWFPHSMQANLQWRLRKCETVAPL